MGEGSRADGVEERAMGRTRTTLIAAAIAVVTWTISSQQRPTAWADPPHPPTTHAVAAALAPADAMQKLREGNQRFVNQKATNAHRDVSRRNEIATAQHPFAV